MDLLDVIGPGASKLASAEDSLKRAVEGDEAAARELVDATLRTLYRRALRLCARPETAKTWVKATYAEALGRAANGTLELSEGLDPALTRVLLEHANSAIHDAGVTSSDSPTDVGGATLGELEQWLSELKPPERFSLVLRELESLSPSATRFLLAFLGADPDETLASARATLEQRAGAAGLDARLDGFRVATATPPTPPLEDVLPPPPPPSERAQAAAKDALEENLGSLLRDEPASNGNGSASAAASREDDLDDAFDSALTGRPSRAQLAAMAAPAEDAASGVENDGFEWFLGVDEKQLGPLTKKEVAKLWADGTIGPTTLAWREGLPDWLAVSRVVDLMDLMARPKLSLGASITSATIAAAMPTRPSGSHKPSSDMGLSALAQQELSAITATAVTEPPKKNLAVSLSAAAAAAHPGPLSPQTVFVNIPAEASSARAPVEEAQVLESSAPAPRARPPPPPADASVPPPAPYVPSYTPPVPRTASRLTTAMLGLVVFDLLLVSLGAVQTLRRPPPPTRIIEVAVAPVAVPPVAVPPVATQTPPPAPPTRGSDVSPSTTPEPTRVSSPAVAKNTGPSAQTTHPASAKLVGPNPGAPTGKVASVGNSAQNDREFAREFKSDPVPKAPAPPKRTVIVPVAPGSGPQLDSLTQQDTMQVAVTHRDAIEKCAREEGREKPNLHGTLVMRWTVQASGKVVGLSPANMKTTFLAKCLTREIARWKFPRLSKSSGPISFPFKF